MASKAVSTNDIVKLRPSQVAGLLGKVIPAGFPVLLVGAPGVGKSDVVAQAAQAAEADLIVSHPVVCDPTDVKGLPWPGESRTEATFLPFGELAQAIRATKRTVWFLDDLGQAPPAVQAAFMQLLLARRVNGHALPDCVSFIGATNRRTDRAGVSGILEPVKSRFASIVELEPHLGDFLAWGLEHGLPPQVIAFLRFRPDLFHVFEPGRDMAQSPSPRTWTFAGKLLGLEVDKATELPMLAGCVGQGAASEFVAFLRIYRELPDLEEVIKEPKKAVIPSEPSALFAVTAGLAALATPENFKSIGVFTERLRVESNPKTGVPNGEFGVLLLRDAFRRDPRIGSTPTFTKFMDGEIGNLLRGEE